MAIFDTANALAAANGDGEFRTAARYWSTELRLDAGDESYLLRVNDGAVVEFRMLQKAELPKVRTSATISASREGWEQLLKPVPRPFFQDLRAAQAREGFVVETDDPFAFDPYYRALNRMFELMRSAGAHGE